MKEQLPLSKGQRFRFTPALEINAKKRLDFFRNKIKDFQKKYPEVIGATIFGSMIRGKSAHNESDVDSILYIDKEVIPVNKRPKDGDYKKEEELAFIYLGKFIKESKIDKNEISKYSIHPVLISEDLIDESIDESKINKGFFEKLKKKVYLENKNLSEEKIDTIMRDSLIVGVNSDVCGLFHAKVGIGIEKYRKMFLEKIYNLEDRSMSEYIWENVYLKVLRFEQGRENPVSINIPKTLDMAIKIYHPDLYKKIINSNNSI